MDAERKRRLGRNRIHLLPIGSSTALCGQAASNQPWLTVPPNATRIARLAGVSRLTMCRKCQAAADETKPAVELLGQKPGKEAQA